jgi:uncharacterized protein YjiK
MFTVFGARAGAAPDASVQPAAPAVIRQARALQAERTGLSSPVGMAFSARSSSFYVVNGRSGVGPADTDVIRLTPFALRQGSDRAGSARITAAVDDPINMAYDARRKRLLFLGHAGELLDVQVGPQGDLDTQTLNRRDAGRFGLRDPQGLAVDPVSGTVFVLDADLPRLVRVDPAPDGGFDGATSSEVDLRPSGLSSVRGLAFDPSSGHLQLRSEQNLLELTKAGELVATRDLSSLELATPQGMVVAPSGDLTDDPAQMSVYVADSGSAQSTGRIAELSLAALPAVASIDVASSLVHTIDTAAWSPPSPDPSGLAYVPTTNRIMMSDAEVEETVNGITHFQGANVWEMTLGGSVARTANISSVAPTVVPMTNEPTGVAWSPSNGHYFFSADVPRRVFDLNPGADNLVGTVDDTWTSFATNISPNTNNDPEGITYDTVHDRLFVADGVNAEIYEYTTTGTLIGHFDVLAYGVADPETVEFNPDSGTLFVLSNRQSGPIIVETTTSGALLRTIDVSAMLAAGGRHPAGLAYAPASNGSGVKHFYIADRGIDNNVDPQIIDGKIFEMTTASSSATIASFSPTVAPAGGSVTLTGTNFVNISSVSLGLINTTFTVDSPTQITATVPPGVAYGYWRVTTGAGTAVSPLVFTVASPTITGFSPASGGVGGTVTISGARFTGTTSVTLGFVSASFTVDSPTQITATVPPGVSYGRWRVANPVWTAAHPVVFTVTGGGGPFTVSPAMAPAGSTVTLTGSGFTGATSVTLGFVNASFTVDSSTQIRAIVPQGVGYGYWRVTTGAGTFVSPLVFSVSSPNISSFSPTNGGVGSTVTITGAGFTGATSVTLGFVNASFTVNSPTQITATVPAGLQYGRWRVATPHWTAVDPIVYTVTG